MSKYELVTDQGGNIGLKCPVCGQARWGEDHKTIDWSTGTDCPNCLDMKQNNDFIKEKTAKDLNKAKADLIVEEAKVTEETNKEKSKIQARKQAISELEKKPKKDEPVK